MGAALVESVFVCCFQIFFFNNNNLKIVFFVIYLEFANLMITLYPFNAFLKIRLEEKHTADVEQLKEEANELRKILSEKEKELANVKAELEIQKEANNRAPTATLKNLVEQLKSQLAIKENQHKVSQQKLISMSLKY